MITDNAAIHNVDVFCLPCNFDDASCLLVHGIFLAFAQALIYLPMCVIFLA